MSAHLILPEWIWKWLSNKKAGGVSRVIFVEVIIVHAAYIHHMYMHMYMRYILWWWEDRHHCPFNPCDCIWCEHISTFLEYIPWNSLVMKIKLKDNLFLSLQRQQMRVVYSWLWMHNGHVHIVHTMYSYTCTCTCMGYVDQKRARELAMHAWHSMVH